MLVPIEIRWLVLVYVIFDLHPVLLALAGTPQNAGSSPTPRTFGGAAFGYLYWHSACTWKTPGTAWSSFGRTWRLRLTRNLRVHRPADDASDDESPHPPTPR